MRNLAVIMATGSALLNGCGKTAEDPLSSQHVVATAEEIISDQQPNDPVEDKVTALHLVESKLIVDGKIVGNHISVLGNKDGFRFENEPKGPILETAEKMGRVACAYANFFDENVSKQHPPTYQLKDDDRRITGSWKLLEGSSVIQIERIPATLEYLILPNESDGFFEGFNFIYGNPDNLPQPQFLLDLQEFLDSHYPNSSQIQFFRATATLNVSNGSKWFYSNWKVGEEGLLLCERGKWDFAP